MQLYFAPLACSMASRIALDEAGAQASFIQVDTSRGRLRDGADFLAINPLSQVPVLRTPDGRLLTENAAILQFVARAYPDAALLGREDELPGLQQWLGFISTELHKVVFTPLLSANAPEEARAAARGKVRARMDVLDRHLAGREYLLDSFTVADAYLVTVLNWTRVAGVDLRPWPSVLGYSRRLKDRPSVARALETEGALFLEEQRMRAARAA
jgi:glutathione S-transferase